MKKCGFCIYSYYNCKNELIINLNACNPIACKCANNRMDRVKKNKEVKK